MKTIWVLVTKDFRLWINDRTGLALGFAVPMALILVFGMVLGGGGGGPSGVRMLVVNTSPDSAALKLVEAMEKETAFQVITERTTEEGSVPLTEADVRDLLATKASSYRYGLIIPEDFTSDDRFGFRVKWLYNPQNQMESQMVNGLFQRAFFTQLPSLMIGRLETAVEEIRGDEGWQLFRENVAIFGEEVFAADGEEVLGEFDAMVDSLVSGGEDLFAGEPGEGGDLLSSLLDVADEQVFGRGRNLATQSIAGFAAMFLLFGLSAAASSLFDERNQQILHRILASRVPRMHILMGKYLFSMLVGVLQLVVLFAFGHLVFDVVDSPSQLPLLGLMMVAVSAAATGFGMIICAYTRTAAQANGVSTLLILTMSALGGAMIPSFLFPAFLRDYITPLTLVHWAVDGFLAILWRDANLVGILPYLGVLLLVAVVTLAIATPRFVRDATFSR